MTHWRCSIRASALEDARASLGPLANEQFDVEAESQSDALHQVKKQITGRHPMTLLPADLLDDWLVAERMQG
ncbi:hypothetical protein J2T57_003157 [Natronocella acetinitrilica]|uniref:Uncharacterized protein n=1 Tax=Natronocella acetinitrilica TaxID=414046 RepID=A0AAE3G8Z5_9GAMM|nr:hypothetical protein [Natronocella acetinitrilica]MCP1676002.1 hypothetical protein [Natronocella acetinitrilica]